MSDLEKKILTAPTLPNTVQGDGRYLMSLLKSFLAATADQVNLANGFSAEEINPSDSAYPTPRNFKLTFDRLGGEFTWSHLADVSNLAYYELRTDTNIGNPNGLLERTRNNYSYSMPVSNVIHAYLYAVSLDAVVSNPTVINNTKAKPDAPQNIQLLTASEGVVLTFSEIPTNCVGANIYINGSKYVTTDNIVSLALDRSYIERVDVAFYDQFGEGERGVLYIVLPDVTGLLVERNGAELDFYWDALNVYGVSYVVKVGTTPDWSSALELFRTKTNDKNRYIYPNTGTCYLLVKATDEYGNYSKNAVYQQIGNEPDIHRNVILEFPQQDTAYGGIKINCYYDSLLQGVTMDADAQRAEYIFDVQLTQKYRARNWMDCDVYAITSGDSFMWDDAEFSWDGAGNTVYAGSLGDLSNIQLYKEISTYKGLDTDNLLAVQLNGDTLTDDDVEADIKVAANDFRTGRWAQGLYISSLTQLKYTIARPSQSFNMVFCLKTTQPLKDTSLFTLAGQDGKYLRLVYNATQKVFSLIGSDGVTVDLDSFSRSVGLDWLTFGISQGTTTRKLFINSLTLNETITAEESAGPIGYLGELYCYPKINLIA